MPLQIDENLPTNFPSPQFLTLNSWKKGVITLLDKSRTPRDALVEGDNLFLVEDGQPQPRPGVDWFGAVSPNAAAIDGFDYFDFSGVIHLVMVAGGNIYRSTDNGTTWTICTGATLTSGVTVNMNQYNAYLYITNGTDNIVRYDGTTTLVSYAALATPGAAAAVETGLATGTAFPYFYKIARVNTVGFSASSPVNTGTVASNLARESWDTTTNFVTLTMPASIATQTRWDIYLSTDNVDYYYLSSVATDPVTPGVVTWVDDGSTIIVPSTTAPTASTAQGPLVKELSNVGSRMYGVRDTVNKYRIWFTSGSPPLGAFSSAYDGGYIDWQVGGKYFPQHVEDYRDGKGTPLATVWCSSADGQGCILQVSLDLVTVGDVSVTVPSAYKLPGSRGTPAPGSVVNVLNDYMFYNSQAFYNLGSRAQYLNLLSTDEASANIRPTIKQITNTAESGISSVYFDAKVYFSVPYGNSSNNYTAIYDTERKCWLPKAFTLGFKKFLRYTDTSGNQRLLALKPGDNRLSQIDKNTLGDYGTAFMTSLVTGLYSVAKDRFEFQWTEEAEFEFSNPQGVITVELLGSERSAGFTSTGSVTITTSTTTTGWDSFLWDTTLWDDTSDVVPSFTDSSVPKYFRVSKELRQVQWRITTNTIDSTYILRTLQTWGTVTTGGHPRAWRATASTTP